jgi:hypothetical protein
MRGISMARKHSAVPLSCRVPSKPDEQTTTKIYRWPGSPSFPACRSGSRLYIPVHSLCAYLGVASQPQLAFLQRNSYLSRYLRRFYVSGKNGLRSTWCLNITAVPLWVVRLDVDKVKPEFQEELINWREQVLDLSYKLLQPSYVP